MVVEQATRESMAALVGPEHVETARDADAVDGVRPAFVVEPANAAEVAAVVAHADHHGLAIAPRGGGTRMTWGNIPARLDLIVSMRRLDQLLEHADGDMTATVQAGITLQDLNDRLAERGQFLPLDVPRADLATIGGLIAVNDSGPLRLRYGGIRDLLIGATIVRADGAIAKGGGKVVKNVAGYDLPKLMIGALGTLGVIVEATFRLYPLPATNQSLAWESGTPEVAGAFILAVLDSTLVPTGLTLRWSTSAGSTLLLRLTGIEPSVLAQRDQALALAQAHKLGEPWRLDASDWSGLHAELLSHECALVARCSVLPSEIPALIRMLEDVAEQESLEVSAVIQAHGLGLVRATPKGTGDVAASLRAACMELRKRLAARGGTLIILAAPLAVKQRLDVWGPAPDALPVMQQIKARFDPNGSLNPGRFLGEHA